MLFKQRFQRQKMVNNSIAFPARLIEAEVKTTLPSQKVTNEY